VTASTAATSRLPLRRAMEARDLEGALDAFAPDAVVRSPITSGLTFTGREQIRAILEVVQAGFEDLRYTDELRDGDRAVLVASTRMGGAELELVDHLRLDADGRVAEMTVFFRPMPAVAVSMRVIGSGLARRRSGTLAALVSLLTRPLGLITAIGDRIGVRLVRSAL
jgi:ketosteroid isomerase-like protein